MFKVLRKGHSLSDPAFWKILQLTINLMIAFIPILSIFIPSIQSELITSSLIKITSALAAFNTYFTIATTTKIGILPAIQTPP